MMSYFAGEFMKFQKSLLTLLVCLMFFGPNQAAKALLVSNIVDTTINYTAKTTYVVTKYSLKAVIFTVKKTAKGVKVISKSFYTATKDAFKSPSKPVKSEICPVKNFKPVNTNVLPPVPTNSLPPVPNNSLPTIHY
jgi:hypothetical protein